MISFDAASVTATDGSVLLHPTTVSLTEHRVSVIGANGSGKSTFARLINGLIEPTSGVVRVGSARSAQGALDTVRDGAAVRRNVGFVFTDPAAQLIMPTAIEDIELSLRRHHRDRSKRRTAALETLRRFGLEVMADRSVHTLSGGQKQMLALATVLATEPEVVVADEPTTLLDLRNSNTITELLMSLPQQLVTVTHDLDLASRADRTLVIDEGQVVFDGPPSAAIHHYRTLAGIR